MIKNFLNPEGHQNPISGSKVTAIILKGLILPLGVASSGEGPRLQPAQQACLIVFTSVILQIFIFLPWPLPIRSHGLGAIQVTD